MWLVKAIVSLKSRVAVTSDPPTTNRPVYKHVQKAVDVLSPSGVKLQTSIKP